MRGLLYGNKNVIPINQVLKQSQSSPQKAQLLFKMVNYFNPTLILELGTSFGFTTAYLANARNKSSKVIGVEGDEHKVYILAQNHINHLELKNIKIINSSFDLIAKSKI